MSYINRIDACGLWLLAGQLGLFLQGAVEDLDPVGAELLAGQVVDFEDGAQARAFAQGLVGALVGAGVEGVGDVQQ